MPTHELTEAVAAAQGDPTPEALDRLATAARIAAMQRARDLTRTLADQLDADGCPDCGTGMSIAHQSVYCRQCGHRPVPKGTIRARALAGLMVERIEARR